MKFFALTALVATTQATASGIWVIADATDGCDDASYLCAIGSCTTGDNNGDVCVPITNTYAAGDNTFDTGTLPTGASVYLAEEDCIATAACTPPAAASALVASAAAVATALYTLA